MLTPLVLGLLGALAAEPAPAEQAAPATCPSLALRQRRTAWDRDRAWMHKPGWFPSLDDPAAVPVIGEGYPDDEPMITVTLGGETRAWPVRAMATHHVANDVVGGVPVAVTY